MPDSVAEMEYFILLEFEPNNLEARIKLGMILLRSEKFDEAIKIAKHILANVDQDSLEAKKLLEKAQSEKLCELR